MIITTPARKFLTILYSLVAVSDLALIGASSPLTATLRREWLFFRPNSIGEFALSQLDLTREGVIATWYSSILLFVTAAAALLVWRSVPRFGLGWLMTALLLVALSADEVAQIHEQLATVYNRSRGADYASRLVVGAGDWLPILMPAIVAVAIAMIALFLLTMRKSKWFLVASLGGLLCWIGALGAESIEAGRWGPVMSGAVEGMIEEGLELIGTTLMLISFVEFATRRTQSTPGVTATAEAEE